MSMTQRTPEPDRYRAIKTAVETGESLLFYCRREAQPDNCIAALKLSHYHTDDPSLLVLNVLLLFLRRFGYLSGHLLL